MNQQNSSRQTTSQRLAARAALAEKRSYVQKRLKQLGLDWIELSRMEALYLPQVLHRNEKIGGVIAGHSSNGHIMLIATDSRIIVLDCKPIFKNVEDITYYVVAGVTIANVGIIYTVTLHTRLGDFKVQTIYAKAARLFKKYIDKRCIEHQQEGYYDQYNKR